MQVAYSRRVVVSCHDAPSYMDQIEMGHSGFHSRIDFVCHQFMLYIYTDRSGETNMVLMRHPGLRQSPRSFNRGCITSSLSGIVDLVTAPKHVFLQLILLCSPAICHCYPIRVWLCRTRLCWPLPHFRRRYLDRGTNTSNQTLTRIGRSRRRPVCLARGPSRGPLEVSLTVRPWRFRPSGKRQRPTDYSSHKANLSGGVYSR